MAAESSASASSEAWSGRAVGLLAILLVVVSATVILGLLALSARQHDARVADQSRQRARHLLESLTQQTRARAALVTARVNRAPSAGDQALVTGADGWWTYVRTAGAPWPASLSDVVGLDSLRTRAQQGPVTGLVARGQAVGAATVGDTGRGERVVVVRLLSPDALRGQGVGAALEGLRFHPGSAGGAGLMLHIADEAVLGTLTWRPSRAGQAMALDLLPPLVAGLALLLLGGGLLLWRGQTVAVAAARAARRAADSERRFRDFAESSSDWFWETTGPDHAFTMVPEVLRPVLGAGLADLLARPPDAHGAGLSGEDGREALREALRQGRRFRELRLYLRWPDGAPLILRLDGQPYHDATGVFLGYRGIMNDVTARMREAAEVARMRDLLREAVEAISEGFVLFGPDYHLVLCNDRYREAYPHLADVLHPGVSFAHLLREAAERNQIAPVSDTWIHERLERHLGHAAPVDQQLTNGQWYRISEHATPSGGIVKVLMDITELKHHEQALSERSTLLRTVFESIDQGLVVFDDHGCLRTWNAAFVRLLDVPHALLEEGTTAADLRALLRERHLLEGPFDHDEVSDDGVMELTLSGGRILEVACRPMPGGGRVVSFADVTERRHFESVVTDLSQNIARDTGPAFFEALVTHLGRALAVDYALVARVRDDGALDCLALWDDGRLLEPFVWEATPTLCALPSAGRRCYYRQGVRAQFPHDRLLARLKAESFLGLPLRDSHDRPVGVIAVLSRRAISHVETAEALLRVFGDRAAAELERTHTLETLRESENRYRDLVDFTPVGVVLWDGDRILFANPAAAALFGVAQPAAVVGESLVPLLDAATLETLHPGVGPREVTVNARDGETRTAEIAVTGFRHEGRAVQLMALNDVTARRRAETALQHAQKMEAVGQLAGGVAHEFNNLLTAIGGFARMAQRSPDDGARVAQCLKHVVDASDRAAHLTGQLLAYSRRQVGAREDTADLGTLLGDVQGFLRPILGETVTLAVSVPEAPVRFHGDVTGVHQAVVNLAINARDAMPEGGTVTVSLTVAPPPPAVRQQTPHLPEIPCAVIAVADQGTGVPPALRERIFEPFFTTKDPGHGTGLGLPMVYEVARAAGGTVTLDSTEGEGSCFTLYLPVCGEEARAGGATAPESGPPWGLRVLLAEDEDSVRSYIQMVLEEHGAVVVSAASGDAALARVREGTAFDVLVTDMVMPGTDGPALVADLARQSTPLRVLFISGYGAEPSRVSLPAGVIADFAAKPVDPDALVAALTRICQAPDPERGQA